MKGNQRCSECGSWDAECASDKPQQDCACARCLQARVRELETRLALPGCNEDCVVAKKLKGDLARARNNTDSENKVDGWAYAEQERARAEAAVTLLRRMVESARPVPFKQGEGTQMFNEVAVSLLDEARALLKGDV